MDSIYWVVSRDCNQRCRHCYNDSEPGAPGLTEAEVDRAVANFPDPQRVEVDKLMLSGGEVLVWPELLFHTLAALTSRYGRRPELMIQTNGDLLDEAMLVRLLDHHVSRVSVASQDDFHLPRSRERRAYLEAMFVAHGLEGTSWPEYRPPEVRKPSYSFWGATPDMWIGKLWPRGRARHYGLSKAGPEDNFCGNWSGAKDFLNYHDKSCQVSLQLGDVYPCCPMTCRPIGSVLEENLIDMLDRCARHPVYRALNEGRPEKMGEYLGLTEAYGRERSAALGNHCLWCDEFFTKHASDLLHQGPSRTARGHIDLTVRGRRYRSAAVELAREAAAG